MTRRILVSRDTGVSIVSQPDPIRIVTGNRGSRGLAAKLGEETGPYDNGDTYSQGLIVSDQGASWIYTNATPGSGNAPPTLPTEFNGYWQLVARGVTVAEVLAALGVNSITISTDPPSGGTDNDIWLQV